MSPQLFVILILGVIVASGLTVWALSAWGVPPLYILIGAMAGSVAVRYWSRKQ